MNATGPADASGETDGRGEADDTSMIDGNAGIDGTWDLIIRTPVGRQDVVLLLHSGQQGGLTGEAAGSAETVPLEGLTRDGDRLTWRQSITRPLRLTLQFDVTVTGDDLHGVSRAGRLPSSRVTGHRRPSPGNRTIA